MGWGLGLVVSVIFSNLNVQLIYTGFKRIWGISSHVIFSEIVVGLKDHGDVRC